MMILLSMASERMTELFKLIIIKIFRIQFFSKSTISDYQDKIPLIQLLNDPKSVITLHAILRIKGQIILDDIDTQDQPLQIKDIKDTTFLTEEEKEFILNKNNTKTVNNLINPPTKTISEAQRHNLIRKISELDDKNKINNISYILYCHSISLLSSFIIVKNLNLNVFHYLKEILPPNTISNNGFWLTIGGASFGSSFWHQVFTEWKAFSSIKPQQLKSPSDNA